MIQYIRPRQLPYPLNIIIVPSRHKLHPQCLTRRTIIQLRSIPIPRQENCLTGLGSLNPPFKLIPLIPGRPRCRALRRWREARKHVEGARPGECSGRIEVEVEFALEPCGCRWVFEGQKRGDISGYAVFKDFAVGCVVEDCSSPDVVL